MTQREFYNKVTNSKIDIIEKFLQILRRELISYCVIGGVGINAYCEPVVTLDFDCVVVAKQIEKLKRKLKDEGFKVKAHPHTWEIRHKGSDVRIQIQRDKRYQNFLKGARNYKVMGYDMMVANEADILAGKVWAYLDSTHDKLKREKDLLDIKRLLQRFPNLIRLR
jgi:hypothetical protein